MIIIFIFVELFWGEGGKGKQRLKENQNNKEENNRVILKKGFYEKQNQETTRRI